MLCSVFFSLLIIVSSLRTLTLIDYSNNNPFFIDVLETKSEEEIIIRISLKKSYLDVSSNDADLLNKISKITIYDGTSDIDVTFTPDNNNKLSFIDSTNTTLLLSINPTLITIKLQSITTTDSFYQLNAEILLVVKGNESLQTFPEIAIANSVNKVSLDFEFLTTATTPIFLSQIIEEGTPIVNENKRTSIFLLSDITTPSIVMPYIEKNGIYYNNGNIISIMTYDISKKCFIYSEENIIITVNSASIDSFTDFKILIDSKEFEPTTIEETKAEFSISIKELTVGSHSIKYIKGEIESTILDDTFEIINDYCIVESPKEIISNKFTITFKYPFDDYTSKTYKIIQDTLSTDISCSRGSNSYQIECIIPTLEMKQYISGDAQIVIEVRQKCDDLTPIPITIETKIKWITLYNTEIIVTFPEHPLVGNTNLVTISSNNLYDLNKVISIKFNITRYSGTIKEIIYTKDGDNQFTYDTSNFGLSLTIFYLYGDKIEPVQIIDDEYMKEFQEGKYVLKPLSPLIFTCPLILLGDIPYKCELALPKWISDNYDVNDLSEIILVDPDGINIRYCNPMQITCNKRIKIIDKTHAEIGITASKTGYYTFTKIVSINGLFNIDFDTTIEEYPKYKRDTSLTYSTKEVQFTSVLEYQPIITYPNDKYLFMNDEYVDNCTVVSGTTKQCNVVFEKYSTQTVISKYLIDNIYIQLSTVVELDIFEPSRKCLNKDDDDYAIVIILSSYKEDRFADYYMTLNGDEYLKVTGVKQTSEKYTFTFQKLNLVNGLYNNFNLKHVTDTSLNYALTDTEIFYYVDTDLISIDGDSTFEGGSTSLQTLKFSFNRDITYIKQVVLTDTDDEADGEVKRLYPSSDCTKTSFVMTCQYNTEKFFGFDYIVSVVSMCNNKEVLTSYHIIPKYTGTYPYIQTDKECFVSGTNVTLKIYPKMTIVDSIKLIDIGDTTEIDISDYSFNKKTFVSFNSEIFLGDYKVRLYYPTGFLDSNEFTIIPEKIILSAEHIFLPNVPRNNLYVSTKNSIIMNQIEYVKLDDVEIEPINYGLSDDKKEIIITLVDPDILITIKDHVVSIKDKSQLDDIRMHIKIVQKPTFEVPQTLFIADSPTKEEEIKVSGVGSLNLINLFSQLGSSYTALEANYKFIADTSITKVITLTYKVEEFGKYYYDITTITIIGQNYNKIFNTVFPCNLLSDHLFSIDLTLLSNTDKIIQSELTLKVYKTNISSEVVFEHDSVIDNKYINSNLEYGGYSFDVYYQSDSKYFYTQQFSLTNFDRKRKAFNIGKEPFTVDFTDVKCDLNTESLELKDSLTVPLSCRYLDIFERYSCELQNSSDISNLSVKDYSVYNTTSYRIHDISLLNCVEPKRKIDSVNKLCVSKCIENGEFKYDHNDECVQKCPFNSALINNFCINEFVVFSEEENVIKVKGPLTNLETVIKNNIESFYDYKKTIISEEYAVQVFTEDSPINNDDYSTINLTSCKGEIKSSSTSILAIMKVDFLDQLSLTNKVEYTLFKDKEIVDREQYTNLSLNITLPINDLLLNLSLAHDFYLQKIDLFKATDPFFNDVCYTFTSKNNTDIILKDRRTLFDNRTFCPTECNYKEINYTSEHAICECFLSPSLSKDIQINAYTSKTIPHNIGSMKCVSFFSSLNQDNIGLYLSLLILFALLSSILILLTKDFISLKQRINHHIVNNPTANISTESPILPTIDEKDEKSKVIDYPEYLTYCTDTFFLSKPEAKIPEVIGETSDFDNLPYKKAIKLDQRDFSTIFNKLYREKELVIKLFNRKSEFELFTLTFNHILFNVSLILFFNAILYTDNMLSKRYKHGSGSFGYDLLRGVCSSIIAFTICRFVRNLVFSFPTIIKMIINEVKTKEFIKVLHKYYDDLFIKLIVYHSIVFAVTLLNFFYLTMFCYVYQNSQIHWILGCVYSIIISFLMTLLLCLFIAAMRIMALAYYMDYLYNLILFIKTFI